MLTYYEENLWISWLESIWGALFDVLKVSKPGELSYRRYISISQRNARWRIMKKVSTVSDWFISKSQKFSDTYSWRELRLKKKTEALDRQQECLNCDFPCVWKQFFGCEEIRLSRCSKFTSVFGKLAYWACWMHVLRKLLTESGFLFRNELKKHVIPIYFSKDNKTSHSSDGFPPCQQNKRTLKKWQKL